MYLTEENCSKSFQPTFLWSSTRGTAHTRAQLPAQELRLPCGKNHVGNSPSAMWQRLTPTRTPKSQETTAASSLPAEGMALRRRRMGSFLSPQALPFPTSGNTQLPPAHRSWKQSVEFFRYRRLPRCESEQKCVNLVQLCGSMDGPWKDAQAQLLSWSKKCISSIFTQKGQTSASTLRKNKIVLLINPSTTRN